MRGGLSQKRLRNNELDGSWAQIVGPYHSLVLVLFLKQQLHIATHLDWTAKCSFSLKISGPILPTTHLNQQLVVCPSSPLPTRVLSSAMQTESSSHNLFQNTYFKSFQEGKGCSLEDSQYLYLLKSLINQVKFRMYMKVVFLLREAFLIN